MQPGFFDLNSRRQQLEKIGTWQQPGVSQHLLGSEGGRILRNRVHGIEDAPEAFLCLKFEFTIPTAT